MPKPVVLDLGPRAPVPAALPLAQAQPVANPQTPPAEKPAESELANDLTEITLPQGNEDLVQAAVLLVKNIDFAVQKSMTPEQIVSQILQPFEERAPALMSMAAGLGDSDQLFGFIQQNVPADWVILSPRGEDLVAKAFEMWTSAEGEDDEGEVA
jgi:hypothetical protein